MKTLSIVLASGVVVGLLVYAVLEAQEWIGLLAGDLVSMRIATFVGVLAAVGFGSAALALAFRRAFVAEEEHALGALRRRIEQLERAAGPAAAAAPIPGR